MQFSEEPLIQRTVEYPNSTVAQAQMALQATRGLHVKSMTSVNQNPGCLRWLLLGWLSLIFKPKPHIFVVYEGKASDLQAAEQAKVEYFLAIQRAANEKQDGHMASLNQVQAFLHTWPGAAAIGVAFFLILAVQALAHMDAPYLLPLLSIALAVIDWQNFSTFHGAIPWVMWKAEGKNWRYYGLGVILWLYGWLFMPLVYAGQVVAQQLALRQPVK